MSGRKIVFILLCELLLFGKQALAHHQLTIITSEIKPYSMQDGDRPGFFHEIVAEIEKRLGTNRKISFYPWPRAQQIADKNEDILIFPMTRIPSREDKYGWLLEITTLDYVFATTKHKINTLNDARTLKTITVRQSTPFDKFLKNKGFTNYIPSPKHAETHMKLLARSRVDAWFGTRDMIHYTAKEQKMDGLINISKPFQQKSIYIATSKKFPKAVKRAYRKIYREMVADGTVTKIMSRY